MELQINEKLVDGSFAVDMTIGEVVSEITERLKMEDKVICQVSVDDIIIPEEKEREVFPLPTKSINRLSLMADTVNNLVASGLVSLKNLIPELIKVLSTTAHHFRTGQTSHALTLFASCLEALEIVPTILDGVRATMKLDYSSISVGTQKLTELETTMLDTIKAIFEAQSKNDHVTLSDLIEYELIPNLGIWLDAIPELEIQSKEGMKIQ